MRNSGCPVCGARSVPWFTKNGRELVRCAACDLIWVPAGLAVSATAASIYQGDEPIFLADGNEQYYLDDTNFRSAERKLAWVKQWVPTGAKLLDVGANFGHFLRVAREDYAATGIELSEVAVRWSRERLTVDNHVGSVYELPAHLSGPYDVVVLWDVIEHLDDPRSALRALSTVVKPGGHLLLSTPDSGSRIARWMGRYWHYLDPVQHLVLFNHHNLRRLLTEAGFEVLATTTFGHYYRVGYVVDRLAYLYRESPAVPLFNALRKVGRPVAQRTLFLNVGDVMGVAARRADHERT